MLKKFLIGTFALVALTFAVSASAAYDFGTTTLRVGSRGEAVKNVQTVVGATPIDGVFGNITKAKVIAWQAAHGLTADGVVGPMTKAAMNAGTTPTPGCPAGALFNPLTGAPCTGTPGTPSTPGTLSGTGEIEDINQLSQYSNEEIGADTEDVAIAGFEVETSNDGDVKLNSIKLTFDATGNDSTDSDRLTDYLDSVKVFMGSKEVGSEDTSDFNRDASGIYSKTIALTDAIIAEDETEQFYVKVDSLSNLDSGDIDSDSWTVAINNIRYVDGQGVVTTETAAIPTTMDYVNAGDGVTMDFVSFSASADTEFKVSLDSSSPEAGVVEISATDNTDAVVLLKGKIKIEGDSDIWMDALPVTLTTTETDISGVASALNLTIDGQEFSESVTDTDASQVIVFDNLDLTLDAGDTVSFTVTADVNDIQASTFDEGTTLTAVFGETETDAATFVAENEAGDALADSEKTGNATGKAQAFYSSGIRVELVSVGTPTVTAGDASATTPTSDTGTFAITFKVTAFGDDMRIDDDAVEDTDGTYSTVTQLSYSMLNTGNVGTSVASLTSSTGATHDTESFLVEEGETETFTLTVAGTATADTFTNLKIEGIGWTAGNADAVGANIYTFDLDDFKTSDVYLNDN